MLDMIDLSTVHILNSPDVHAWPATTAITQLALRPTGVHVEFTKQNGADRWPDVPFGDSSDHGALQFTLWIVLNVLGQWCAAGCIEFWHGLYESGGPVDGYAKNWYYDPTRWPGMAGHQPAAGEHVGFFITSGDARHGDDGVGLHERSNIVAIEFPDVSGGVFTFNDSLPAPAPVPPSPPLPFPAPAPTPAPAPAPGPSEIFEADVDRFFESLERLVGSVETIARCALAIEGQLEQFGKSGVRVHL